MKITSLFQKWQGRGCERKATNIASFGRRSTWFGWRRATAGFIGEAENTNNTIRALLTTDMNFHCTLVMFRIVSCFRFYDKDLDL